MSADEHVPPSGCDVLASPFMAFQCSITTPLKKAHKTSYFLIGSSLPSTFYFFSRPYSNSHPFIKLNKEICLFTSGLKAWDQQTNRRLIGQTGFFKTKAIGAAYKTKVRTEMKPLQESPMWHEKTPGLFL